MTTNDLHIVTPPVGENPTPDAYRAACDALEREKERSEQLRAEATDLREDRDTLLAKLAKVRAQLADTQKRAHTDATNLQQILRDKTALANERDAMREVVKAAKTWRNNTGTYSRYNDELALVAAVDALTDGKAWLLGGHTPVVRVRGESSCIALTHVDVLPGQPDGIEDDSLDTPDPIRAAERVNEYIAANGDGIYDVIDGHPLYARDMFALARFALTSVEQAEVAR